MAVYKIFPEKDATMYSGFPLKNTGIDEILEISTFFDTTNPEVSRALVKFSQTEIEDVVLYDPRVQLDQVEVNEFEHGIQVKISLLYIGYGIGESIDLLFDNQQGLLTGPSSFYPANTTN